MERLRLPTLIGPSVDPATVEFGPKLTLVRGPSDTGKSHIADTLDFMLGSSRLEEIPEHDGYDQVLLGLRLPDGESVTLARSPDGGQFSLFHGDYRAYPLPVDRTPLSAKHSPKATIPERADQIARRKAKGKAGGRPPAFDPDLYKLRNVVERCFNRLKQFRGMATRYAKRAAYHRAELILACIVLHLR